MTSSSNVTIRNEIRGVNLLNEGLWFARQVRDQDEWEGTGLKNWGLTIFVDFKAALQFFLTNYPETDTIAGMLGGQYRIAFPNQAPATTILDAIAKELGQ